MGLHNNNYDDDDNNKNQLLTEGPGLLICSNEDQLDNKLTKCLFLPQQLQLCLAKSCLS